jgi:hypothetical protein
MRTIEDVRDVESVRMENEYEDWRLTICLTKYEGGGEEGDEKGEGEGGEERGVEVLLTEVEEEGMDVFTRGVMELFENCFEHRLSQRRLLMEQKVSLSSFLFEFFFFPPSVLSISLFLPFGFVLIFSLSLSLSLSSLLFVCLRLCRLAFSRMRERNRTPNQSSFAFTLTAH